MSAPRPDTWMPWYIGDYLADTMHLTRDQHGGYMLLIMAYWRRGGPLPDDDDKLASIVKATAAEWRKLRPLLAEFFQIEGGWWIQKRAQIELDDATKITNDRSTAGSKGAAKRWQGHKQTDGNDGSKPDGKPVAKGWQNDRPLPSPSLPERENPSSARAIAGTQSRIPRDWQPDEEIRQFALQKLIPDTELNRQAELFRDHYLGTGEDRADWNASFRKWLNSRGQFETAPRQNGAGSAAPAARPRIVDKAAREAEMAAAEGREVERAPRIPTTRTP